MSPLLYLLAMFGGFTALIAGFLVALEVLRRWHHRHEDPAAQERLARHAERKAAENGRPYSSALEYRATRQHR